MKATETQLLSFLKKSSQFVIPIYQRTYSWTEKECYQLWEDIVRAGKDEAISVHFIGSIVYIESGLSQVSHQAALLVIDGQQRLTTVTLLLAALAEELGDEEPMDGFSAQKLRNYYLLNPEEAEERRYKILLSQTDKASLKAIVSQSELPDEKSRRIIQNYNLFKKWIADCKGDLKTLCNGLAKLVVVDIALSRDQDNPQLIFESMNSTGRELSQADLIRNYILMGLEQKIQTELYEKFWRPMELDFGQEAYDVHFDGFMKHYLTIKTGSIPTEREVYEVFKGYARTPEIAEAGVEALVKDMRDYAHYYCAMALGKEPEPDLNLAFRDLRELKVNVAYPFLLELYHDYKTGILPKDDILKACRLVESYVFRRAICGIPTNSLNKTFSTFYKALRKETYLESIRAHFLFMPSYRRFPNDEEFMREFQTHDLYNFRSRSYWLRRFENHDRKELVPVDEYTIEHIMPQELPPHWKDALGSDWESVHQKYLHTAGNLTLTGYNSEYSNRTFAEKRDMEGGFRDSPLRVNAGLGSMETWDEEAIQTRGDHLASRAAGIWQMPKLANEVLDTYHPQTKPSGSYTINDHRQLQSSELKELFEKFRQEVLALDPCVSEEFLKSYIAYKAETNFVDIVPRSKHMTLSLNMNFPDIQDPKGLCEDVSSRGRLGNGDVQVKLRAHDELPYVIGLVRQSLEKQLGSITDE